MRNFKQKFVLTQASASAQSTESWAQGGALGVADVPIVHDQRGAGVGIHVGGHARGGAPRGAVLHPAHVQRCAHLRACEARPQRAVQAHSMLQTGVVLSKGRQGSTAPYNEKPVTMSSVTQGPADCLGLSSTQERVWSAQ